LRKFFGNTVTDLDRQVIENRSRADALQSFYTNVFNEKRLERLNGGRRQDTTKQRQRLG